MNFYIGTKLEELDLSGRNVELSDDLLNFILKNNSNISDNISVLRDINPYSDEVISLGKLDILLNEFNQIINSFVLDKYEDDDEVQNVYDICTLIRDAIETGNNIISIGD